MRDVATVRITSATRPAERSRSRYRVETRGATSTRRFSGGNGDGNEAKTASWFMPSTCLKKKPGSRVADMPTTPANRPRRSAMIRAGSLHRTRIASRRFLSMTR